MDIMNCDDGGMWFQSSGSWGEDREVSYFGQARLVPLLRTEVPFDYPSGLVFLWDRNYGVAVASRLVDAWLPDCAVLHERSRAALVDKPVYEEGFCYLNATAGQIVNGPYPTAGELVESGDLDNSAVVSYTRVDDGRYHCAIGGQGLEFDQLDRQAVVGSSVVAARFGGTGCMSEEVGEPLDQWVFDRSCVVGANAIDLCEADRSVVVDVDDVCSVDVRWFAHRELSEGLFINMGIIWLGSVGGSNVAYGARCPGELSAVYWFDRDKLRGACCQTGLFQFAKPEGLVAMYVYGVTDRPIVGTVYHPIKCKGCVSKFCTCRRCVPGADGCASFLLGELDCSCSALSLLTLSERVAPGVAVGSYVSWSARGLWHVTERGVLSLEEVLESVRAAVRDRRTSFKVHGEDVSVHDLVGASSGVAVVLRQLVPALALVSEDRLDECGAALAGCPPGVLGASQKTKLKVLQVVGDNLLSLHLSLHVDVDGSTAQDYQEQRSRYTCNPYLRDLFVSSALAPVFAGGVADMSHKTGGGAFEAVVAVAFKAGGMVAVDQLLELVGFGSESN